MDAISYSKAKKAHKRLDQAIESGQNLNGWVEESEQLNQKIDQKHNEVTSQLAQSETEIEELKTSKADNARIDNIIAQSGTSSTEVVDARQSTAKNKTFATVKTRLEEIETDAFIPMTNIIANGDFANGTTGTFSFNATRTVVEGKLQVLASASNGYAYGSLISLKANHKYHLHAVLKGDSSSIVFLLMNNSSPYQTFFSINSDGKNADQVIDVEFTPDVDVSTVHWRVRDGRSAGWTPIEIDNILLVDKTEILGVGNEPTTDEMKLLLGQYPNSYFEGTVNFASNRRTVPYIIKKNVNIANTQKTIEDKLVKHTQNYELDSGKIIERFENNSDWLLTGNGVIETDFKRSKIGTQTMKLSVTTAGGYVDVRKNVQLSLKDTNKMISLWVYFDKNILDCQTVSVFLFNTPGKYFYGNKYPSILQKGWNLITIAESDWVGVGTPSWNENITTIGIRVTASTGKTCSVTVDDMRVGMAWQPKIIFRFDDGWENNYTNAFPIMEPKGLKGVIYISSDKIDAAEPGFMTVAQMQELYNAGWDIGNHTDAHVNLWATNYAQTYSAVKDCQDWLIQNGFYKSARHFCVPEGKDTEFLQQALDDAGTLTSTNSIHATYVPTGMDLHKIPSEAVYDTTPVSTITGWIDKAVASGRTLVIMFHNIADTGVDEYHYSLANFQAVVDYIANKGYSKYVVTMSEFYEGLNRD